MSIPTFSWRTTETGVTYNFPLDLNTELIVLAERMLSIVVINLGVDRTKI